MAKATKGKVDDRTVTPEELAQVERANESGKVPVVFVHGLWLLPSSWDRWAELFEGAGYAVLTPSWPDDPETVAEARATPGVLAKKTIGQVADHTAAVIGELSKKPAVIGHSTGGLLAQTTEFVALDALSFQRSAEILVMLVLGGAGRLYGGLIGALIFMVARDQLADMNPQYWYFWLGLLLIAVIIFLPNGILGGCAHLLARWRRQA